MALYAEAEHDDHANEGNQADSHPDVLPDLIGVCLHRSVDVEPKRDGAVGVVEGGDELAEERVAQNGEVSYHRWDVGDCYHAGWSLSVVSRERVGPGWDLEGGGLAVEPEVKVAHVLPVVVASVLKSVAVGLLTAEGVQLANLVHESQVLRFRETEQGGARVQDSIPWSL